MGAPGGGTNSGYGGEVLLAIVKVLGIVCINTSRLREIASATQADLLDAYLAKLDGR